MMQLTTIAAAGALLLVLAAPADASDPTKHGEGLRVPRDGGTKRWRRRGPTGGEEGDKIKRWRRRGGGSLQSADGGGQHLSHASANSEAGKHGAGHDNQRGEQAAARDRCASTVV